MRSLKNMDMTESETIYLKLWLQLAKSSKAIEQEMESRFQRTYKQSMSRFDVLSQLDRCDPEWLPIGKLAKQLLSSRGNITRLVDRMIAEGLVDRRPSPEDRRIIQVGLTNKGRDLFTDMAVAHAQWAKSLLADLNPKKSIQLLDLLVDVNKAVKTSRDK
ncbi:MAG: MarR family transcriptional regulator [Haliea sp.]